MEGGGRNEFRFNLNFGFACGWKKAIWSASTVSPLGQFGSRLRAEQKWFSVGHTKGNYMENDIFSIHPASSYLTFFRIRFSHCKKSAWQSRSRLWRFEHLQLLQLWLFFPWLPTALSTMEVFDELNLNSPFKALFTICRSSSSRPLFLHFFLWKVESCSSSQVALGASFSLSVLSCCCCSCRAAVYTYYYVQRFGVCSTRRLNDEATFSNLRLGLLLFEGERRICHRVWQQQGKKCCSQTFFHFKES